MTTEDKEQPNETEEPKVPPTDEEPVPKEEGEEPSPPTEEEKLEQLQKRIGAEANRIANKSTAALQSQNVEFQKTIAQLNREASYREEDSKLSQLEKAQKNEWSEAPTHQVGTFQEAVRETRQREREIQRRETDTEAKESELLAIGRRQDAFEKALRLFLPENEEFISDIEAFVEKLKAADTQKEMDLIFEAEESRIRAEAEAKQKPKLPRTTPDSNLASAPGGGSKKESEIIRFYADNPHDRAAKEAWVQLQRSKGKKNI